MKNVHITLTDFRNASRILKEIDSLVSHNVFERVSVLALGSDSLSGSEVLSDRSDVTRFVLKSRKLPKSLPFQVIKFIEFSIKCISYVKKEKPGVINIHTLGLLPLGLILKILFGVKLVYDAHELETEKNGLAGIRKSTFKWLESKLINYCNLVIVVSDSIADWYQQTYNIKRPVVVKNSPNFRDFKRKNLFRDELGIDKEQTILLYQGGLVKGRGIELILDAFKHREDTEIVAVFMGYGELEDEIKAASLRYSNIYYYPAVSPKVVLDYTTSADIGIHLIQNSCLNHFYCLPNKFFEYAMAGLPIIVSNMKEMERYVIDGGFGEVLTGFSSKEINRAIDKLVNQDLEMLSKNAFMFAKNNSWEYQENEMLIAYKGILQK